MSMSMWMSMACFMHFSWFVSVSLSLLHSATLGETTCAYSRSVLVCRSSEATGYAQLAHPYRMSFIGMAAVQQPQIQVKEAGVRMRDVYAERTKEKMR